MIGFIDVNHSLMLKDLQKIGEIKQKILLTTSEWMEMIDTKSRKLENTVEISISGNEEHSDAVGAFLSRVGLFLQAPRFSSGIPHKNPHLISFPGIIDEELESKRVEVDRDFNPVEPRSSRPSAHALSSVLDNLQQHNYLHLVKPDKSLIVELFE
jgi:hypothetical protein